MGLQDCFVKGRDVVSRGRSIGAVLQLVALVLVVAAISTNTWYYKATEDDSGQTTTIFFGLWNNCSTVEGEKTKCDPLEKAARTSGRSVALAGLQPCQALMIAGAIVNVHFAVLAIGITLTRTHIKRTLVRLTFFIVPLIYTGAVITFAVDYKHWLLACKTGGHFSGGFWLVIVAIVLDTIGSVLVIVLYSNEAEYQSL